ncbi:hypothetical protein BC939DRAFT_456340 [Gamsiella multidivaricata]|uniref:uncharacterized protein n=1 Tax=Gamsiella multidivaricata TaxID=101098 RepID=UPI0022204947|nr:uncharacterized protein BC939DRAFT_456340 [Gamsiella multidivaricata]KAI7821039.1 hypothetical protein BC939DRAFT_456340 [Gamsiella multidivaricata]
MAVRNAAQGNSLDASERSVGRGRQLSIGSVTSSASTPSHSMAESPVTATPPTPIPSPRNEGLTKQDVNDKSQSRPVQRVRDMTHNVHSRSGSVDENEEMVLDMYGRSIPRSRRQSSDEGSDYGADNNRSRRRRRSDIEDDYRNSYYYPERYEPRHRSRSRSLSRSSKRRIIRHSRSRSVSPYYPQTRERGYSKRREDDRDYERDPRPEHESYRADGPELDPYMAASRYLDTAFYPTKIYVGNLPESATLTTLRTAFGPFGDIEDMNLVEGKDFGFVTYKDPEAAREALQKMNGSTLDGVEIRVNRAKIPERNRHGFAGVAWMDEDGELAKLEEEQHKQAAAIAKTILGPGLDTGSGSACSPLSSPATFVTTAYGTRGQPLSISTSPVDKPARAVHQLPPRPKLPPKPSVEFPPVGADPRAAIAARGGGRQILTYDDL